MCHSYVKMILFQDPLEFQVRELRKYFQVGDHVKVIAGRHEGETGLIVRIENNLAIVFADLTMHEVQQLLLVNDVRYYLN